jgi:hypothetical protein
MGWVFTACLHWPDVDTATPLGPGWAWDQTCTSIVNSDGIAADPLRELVTRGGALHTPAAPTPHALTELVGAAWDDLLPGSNYRTHLTVTVRAPGLEGDLAACKRLVVYTRMHLPNVWPAIDPLDALLHRSATEHELAQARTYLDMVARPVRRALASERRHQVRLAASTVEQFIGAGNTGGGLRECVSLDWDGSVTVSCLAAPHSPEQFRAAVEFVQAWITAALTGADPLAVAIGFGPRLAQQQPFDVALEAGWRATNVRDNPRWAVEDRLRRRPGGVR